MTTMARHGKGVLRDQGWRIVLAMAFLVASGNALADTHWNGAASNDWSDPANWDNGAPEAGAGNGNAIVNPGGANGDPVVSTTGNTTDIGVYISVSGVGMSITSEGALDITDTFVTGVWGDSGLVTTAGELSIGGYLNLGAGGYDGDLLVTGGTVSATSLSINTTGSASIDMTGGKLVFPEANLGNIEYWVDNDAITAYGGMGTIDVDQTTIPGSVILTPLAAPTFIEGPHSAEEGGSVSLTAPAGSDWQWYMDGIAIEGATEKVLLIDPVTQGDAGAYTCEYNSGNGIIVTEVFILTVSSSPSATLPLAGPVPLLMLALVVLLSGALALRRGYGFS